MATTPNDSLSLSDIKSLGFGNHRISEASSYDGVNQNKSPINTGDYRSTSRALTDTVYGINHRQTPLAIPMNKDHYGFTFFTRPQLNMQHDNLTAIRRFVRLLNNNPLSIERVIRCYLDPRLQVGLYHPNIEPIPAIECPLVDKEQVFIPLLTNTLLNISGWPDISSPIWTAKDGPYKESYSLVDGNITNYQSYNVTANFRNVKTDPITKLFSYWTEYQSAVFEGVMTPYGDMIFENEIDYNTRIYRITLDPSKQIVRNIACCGAAFPISDPIGAIFDYSSEKPYNDANAEISISFQCMGFWYNDDIIIESFNKAVRYFHSGMYPDKKDSYMKMIPYAMLPLFNNRGYPYIDPKSMQLQWYVTKQVYEAKLAAYKDFDKMLDGALGLAYTLEEHGV
mgnify:CR=1 FL=1